MTSSLGKELVAPEPKRTPRASDLGDRAGVQNVKQLLGSLVALQRRLAWRGCSR